MRSRILIGRIFGIEIALHYSWFIIATLITVSLAGHFRMNNPEWGISMIWALSVCTAVLFFAALLTHELSHALVAKAYGLPVRKITLFALGGMAHMSKESQNPKAEFFIGIIGPVTSFVIGFLCVGLAMLWGWQPQTPTQTPLQAMLIWLGFINVMLAIFNMIPGFPLDGGRVMRAVIWRITGNAAKALRMSARIGQMVAAGFMAYGIVRFFGGAGFGGLWLTIVGLFLFEAAGMSLVQAETTAALKDILVRDVMEHDCPTVNPELTLADFIHERLLRTGRRGFVVEEDGDTLGFIGLSDVRKIGKSQWETVTVREAMRPLERLKTVEALAPVAEALELMAQEDVNQIPVLTDHRLQGMISRTQVIQFIQTRSELEKSKA